MVLVAIRYGRRCHVRCQLVWRWPLESHESCHESIWRLTCCVVRIFDAKYLCGFYCISRRLTLLFVKTINFVVDTKRHADLDVIDNFCFPFLERIFFLVHLLLACLFVYCILCCFFCFRTLCIFCSRFTTRSNWTITIPIVLFVGLRTQQWIDSISEWTSLVIWLYL